MPVVASKGEGWYIYDIEGKKYLDFNAAWGAIGIGHWHPKLV